MPPSTSLLEAKTGPFWDHLGTSSNQIDLWSASTTWTSFFPLGCAALQVCSMNTLMPFNMPCKSTKCRTCYTTWMVTLLLVHQTPQFVPTSWPWLLHVRELGFDVNPKKVTKPTTTMNFLSVDVDSVTMEARIDPSHLSETTSLLKDISGQHSATKWTILSLVGILHFVCHVCRPGRAFLHHMIKASMKAQYLHHGIKLNEEFHWDVD